MQFGERIRNEEAQSQALKQPSSLKDSIVTKKILQIPVVEHFYSLIYGFSQLWNNGFHYLLLFLLRLRVKYRSTDYLDLLFFAHV